MITTTCLIGGVVEPSPAGRSVAADAGAAAAAIAGRVAETARTSAPAVAMSGDRRIGTTPSFNAVSERSVLAHNLLATDILQQNTKLNSSNYRVKSQQVLRDHPGGCVRARSSIRGSVLA